MVCAEVREVPQNIITDHLNHVKKIAMVDKLGMSVINMMSPLVDLWRLVKRALRTRGGLHPYDDEHQLKCSWQRAHQRAKKSETYCQKRWRRGNFAADWVCNIGRQGHTDDVRCNRCTDKIQLRPRVPPHDYKPELEGRTRNWDLHLLRGCCNICQEKIEGDRDIIFSCDRWSMTCVRVALGTNLPDT